MENYDTKYEEYKSSILKSGYFANALQAKYESTLSLERDYIDKNGVLWKVALLSGLCSFCLVFSSIFDDRSDLESIVIRIVLAIIGIVSFALAMHIGSKYKVSSGRSNFYSFHYSRFIHDHVLHEKQREADNLMRDMLDRLDNIQWRAEQAEAGTNNDIEPLQSNLLYIIKASNEFHKRYEYLSMYDRFSEDLQQDYHFNQAVRKLLE